MFCQAICEYSFLFYHKLKSFNKNRLNAVFPDSCQFVIHLILIASFTVYKHTAMPIRISYERKEKNSLSDKAIYYRWCRWQLRCMRIFIKIKIRNTVIATIWIECFYYDSKHDFRVIVFDWTINVNIMASFLDNHCE